MFLVCTVVGFASMLCGKKHVWRLTLVVWVPEKKGRKIVLLIKCEMSFLSTVDLYVFQKQVRVLTHISCVKYYNVRWIVSNCEFVVSLNVGEQLPRKSDLDCLNSAPCGHWLFMSWEIPSQPQPPQPWAISASAICFYCVYLNKATKTSNTIYIHSMCFYLLK